MTDSTLGILACLFTVLCWTVGTFAFTRASRILDPSTVNRVRLLYALIILTLITSIAEGFSPLQLILKPSADQFLWFGLSGLIGFTIGDYLYFHAFKILGGRRASVFISIAPAAALLSGMILLGEHLSFIGIVGMAISICGILMLSLSRTEKQEVLEEGHGLFVQGIVYAVLGSVCQGVGLVLSKKGFTMLPHEIGALHATWIRLAAATLSAYTVGIFRINIVDEFKRVTFVAKNFEPVITGTIVGPVLGVTFSLFHFLQSR